MAAALRLTKGEPVEVRIKGPRNDFMWRRGVIREPSGKGAFVRLEHGGDNFFYLSDIRPAAPEPQPKPLATIGDKIAMQQEERTNITPLRSFGPKPVPSPSSTTDAPPPSIPPKPTTMDNPPTPRFGQSLSVIGAVFREYRVARGHSQAAVAIGLKIPHPMLCRIELGLLLPDDDVLLTFAEAYDVPIEQLIEAREVDENSASERPKSTNSVRRVAPVPPPKPEQEPPLPRPVAPPVVAPPAAAVAPMGAFEEFIERLNGVIQMPVDRERRAKWFASARALYALEHG
jgi:transcriptional regulator with XRE-family HTH domain